MAKIVEDILPISGIDKVTCETKLKGAYDEHGRCLIRIRLGKDPNKAELEKIEYIGPPPAGPAPVQP